mmetsp:Transcript_26815/g.86865  ORF Transcript_26815/g.86865 Transcript_26815/m.86865 type:complete len:398 (+) Transcript_26815:3-1196(+)
MAAARPATSLMATSRLSMGAPQARLAAPLSAMAAARPASSLMATSRISMAAPQVATARLSAGMPRGVDLNLDKFNLSQVDIWAGTLAAPEGAEKLAIDTEAFWLDLDGPTSATFTAEDRALLSDIYNPTLSDRRSDGACFVPPPTSLTYMHKLKQLVKEESMVMQERKAHFFSTDFNMENVGPLFPSSWTSSIQLDGQAQGALAQRVPRPDLEAQQELLREVLSAATPAFERQTEDGTHFLVYKIGSLEVRATKARDGRLSIGAVFSVGSAPPLDGGCRYTEDSEKVVKVTKYVERCSSGKLRCKYYVVVRTEEGNAVVVEKLLNGSVVWTENPEDLESRNFLAKVMRSEDCKGSTITVGELRGSARLSSASDGMSPSECKQYAQTAYRLAIGDFVY